uniref:Uncharacterized protein n=1 Tax=Arundo donax TaxID=35708 RepID=A0A0A8ZTU9_ARUDO
MLITTEHEHYERSICRITKPRQRYNLRIKSLLKKY